MKVENNFIYRLTDRLGTLAVIPLGEKGFSLDFERQNEDKLSYEKKLSGKIMFVGEAFHRLKQMEKATEAQKLKYNTYDDQIKVIDTQINKIAHGNAGEKDLYSIDNPNSGDITPEKAIIELKANREQLVELQKEIANKI